MFDQDMWLYYMCLKQHFFSSVFFRFLLMLTMSEKILFVWFSWLVSKYKNKPFLFLSRFALLISHLSSEAATSSVLCSVFRNTVHCYCNIQLTVKQAAVVDY